MIPKTCKALHLEKKIPLHNNGTPIRTWLNVEDTALAVMKIIDSGVKNEIYNISGGFEQNNYETVKKVIRSYTYNQDLESIDDYLDLSYHRVGQDVRYSLDDSKLRKLGWEPIINFDEAIPVIVDYYRNKFIW